MDQMMFDITGVDTQLGDVITLLDETHSIDKWANILGTINYELTCRLKVRLPRVYTRQTAKQNLDGLKKGLIKYGTTI